MDETGTAVAVIANQATAKDCAYLLVLDSSGTCKIIQGAAVAVGTTCKCPGTPTGYAPFGAVKVSNATGSVFTFGTTALNTASLTVTYFDLSASPDTL
jgi:1,4-dihydroxy-2-naphthoate octaprenyltransferase